MLVKIYLRRGAGRCRCGCQLPQGAFVEWDTIARRIVSCFQCRWRA